MRAVVHDRYGGTELLRLREVAQPVSQKGEVRLRVMACSVNLTDWEGLTGRPAYARMGGLFKPKRQILGSDIVGEVVSIGPGVSGFETGTRVFGDFVMTRGGFAEQVCVPASLLAPVPEALSDEVAACLPQAGAIAVQGISGAGSGDRVLINGAGGGSGTLALALAKQAGAHVTAVDNAGKLEWLTKLGADEVIDYRTTDFATTGARHDLILDLVATRGARAIARVLRPDGSYRCVGGNVRTLASLAIVGKLRVLRSQQSIGVLAVKTGSDVTIELGELAVDGRLRPLIEEVVPLDRVAEAIGRVGRGEVRGKLVVVP